MFIRITLLVLFLILKHKETNAEVYNSVYAMETLVETQGDVVNNIQKYLDKAKKKLDYVKKFLERMERDHEILIKDVRRYLENPINMFHLLWRMTKGLDNVESFVSNKTEYIRNVSLVYPDQEDLKGAVAGIMRLQETYRLNITQLAQGELVGNFSENNTLYKEHVTPMTSWDCVEIAQTKTDLNSHRFRAKIEWLRRALSKLHKGEGCAFCPFNVVDIVDYLARLYYVVGDGRAAIVWMKGATSVYPEDPVNKEREAFIQLLEDKIEAGELDEESKHEDPWVDRWAVRGCYEDLAVQDNFKGYCYYDSGSSFLTLSPAKTEVLFDTPAIVLFHGFLRDSEVELLIALAKKGNMTTGTVSPHGTVSDDPAAKGRAVQQTCLNESLGAVTRIVGRIKLYTDLNFDNSAPISVVNYGIAGYIGEHSDNYITDEPKKKRERSTSVIVYLSQATQGGAMVFPNIGVKIYPEPGAALVFDNMLPSGDVSQWGIHTGCPVLRGDKWIATKWANEDDQKTCPMWFDDNGRVVTQEMCEKYKQHLSKVKEAKTKNNRL